MTGLGAKTTHAPALSPLGARCQSTELARRIVFRRGTRRPRWAKAQPSTLDLRTGRIATSTALHTTRPGRATALRCELESRCARVAGRLARVTWFRRSKQGARGSSDPQAVTRRLDRALARSSSEDGAPVQFVGEVHTTETYAAWRAAQRARSSRPSTRPARRSVATSTATTTAALAAGLPHAARGRGHLERSRRPVNPSGLKCQPRRGPRQVAPPAATRVEECGDERFPVFV